MELGHLLKDLLGSFRCHVPPMVVFRQYCEHLHTTKASSEGSSTVAAVNWQPRRPMCCKALRNCGSCMYYLDSSLVWLE